MSKIIIMSKGRILIESADESRILSESEGEAFLATLGSAAKGGNVSIPLACGSITLSGRASQLASLYHEIRERQILDEDSPETPEELEKRFRKEIQGWDWRGIKRECEGDLEPDPYNGGKRGGSYLGSVFRLYPSGKYYMPWACSNVDACARCGGEGRIVNPKADSSAHSLWNETIRAQVLAKGDWHQNPCLRAQIDAINDVVEMLAPNSVCPSCHGSGSVEATFDEVFGEVLEEIAESHGLTIESGEGDPTDVLAVLYSDAEDDEDSECVA